MAETYEIFYDGECIGRAAVERKGLYLCFSCRCRLPDEGLYRIHVRSDEGREDLGICVPMDEGFGMDKRIPIKHLGEGKLHFELIPKDRKRVEITAPELPEDAKEEATACLERVQQFIPVSEDEPFDHLDKLETAHMEIRDDLPGIVIEDAIDVN